MSLFKECTNTNQQGAVGESIAELFFRCAGYEVARMGSHAPYDMIVCKCNENFRIQVKTTRNRNGEKGNYTVFLRTNYGHGDRTKFKTIDADSVQKVFVVTEHGACYLFPVEYVAGKNCITLNAACAPYFVSNVNVNLSGWGL